MDGRSIDVPGTSCPSKEILSRFVRRRGCAVYRHWFGVSTLPGGRVPTRSRSGPRYQGLVSHSSVPMKRTGLSTSLGVRKSRVSVDLSS